MMPISDRFDIGPARGARASKAKMPHPPWRVVRSLEAADIELLLSPPLLQEHQREVVALGAIRQSHHMLAQLLVEGKSQVEASQRTGYSPTYISIVQRDPSFQELMAHYAKNREEVFVDTLERMRGLGLHTLEELQARLTEDPNQWSRRELMELAELCLVKPMTATRGVVPNAAPGVTVSVNFVSPGDRIKNVTIDHEGGSND